MTWSWLVPPRGEGPVTWDKLVPFLDPAANLCFDLAQDAGAADGPITTVKVSFENLPMEWIDDLTAYWTYKLGEAERVYTVNYRD